MLRSLVGSEMCIRDRKYTTTFSSTAGAGGAGKTDMVVALLADISFMLNKEANQKMRGINKYQQIMVQLLQALSGADTKLIKQSEYYSDLRETLRKIHANIRQASKRKLIARLVMSGKDSQSTEEIQKVVDNLCGRIFLSYAQMRSLKQKMK